MMISEYNQSTRIRLGLPRRGPLVGLAFAGNGIQHTHRSNSNIACALSNIVALVLVVGVLCTMFQGEINAPAPYDDICKQMYKPSAAGCSVTGYYDLTTFYGQQWVCTCRVTWSTQYKIQQKIVAVWSVWLADCCTAHQVCVHLNHAVQ